MSELAALLGEIRQQVADRHASSAAGGIPLPDLLPILQARDVAQGKVAAIGTVNPRPGGLLNSAVQFCKRMVSRSLDWHVREQVEFNRAVVTSLEAILSALEENNRLLAHFSSDAQHMQDATSHWKQWRADWEDKLAKNETHYLRGLLELQSSAQHRALLAESSFRDLMRAQHADFTAALERAAADVQERLWADLERIRLEYESIIHNELRLVRQRAALAPPQPALAVPQDPPFAFDYLKFSEKFRGPEEYVRTGQLRYAAFFQGCRSVLDLGCGRGEFLQLMREHNIPARGIEQSGELVALCRQKDLQAEEADMFAYLDSLGPQSVDGIFCSQVIEHLPPHRLPGLIQLAFAKLKPGGRLAMETPNPECLAIFSTHFFLDPTHTRPIPPALLAFYFEESGFGQIEIQRFAPAIESMPSLALLPEDFRNAFFANLDYAVLARRLS
ncbi:MAG: class I SAM-dependent methyltransferase [Acidobacteriia bacterium]|nr:class I SAM-dependent methyltransferase [Terriglobia bacterium]